MRAADHAKMRAEVTSGLTMDRLTYFMRRYAPTDPHEREQFQMALMHIVVDLMRHQGNMLDHGIETGFGMSQMYHERAAHPIVHHIMNPPERK
jgi:hypothetical protein